MKQIITLLLLLCSMTATAQDVIEKTNGQRLECKIVQVTSNEIIFKKWTDLKGSNYIMNRSDARSIYYQDGSVLQGRQYQDAELLAMTKKPFDYNKTMRNANICKWTGIVGGSAGAILTIVGMASGDGGGAMYLVAFGLPSVAWCGGFLIASKELKKKANRLNTASVYQQDFTFKNGTTFSVSTDLNQDNLTKQSSIGLGFHYNF